MALSVLRTTIGLRSPPPPVQVVTAARRGASCRICPTVCLTAAAAWSGYRQSEASIDDLGVQVGPLELKGAPFVFASLIMDVAHRFGDELLLWDYWGAMAMPGQVLDLELGDRPASLVLRADAGDQQAEQELADIHATDPRVRPGSHVLQFSPRDEQPRKIALVEPAGDARD